MRFVMAPLYRLRIRFVQSSSIKETPSLFATYEVGTKSKSERLVCHLFRKARIN
jgi:hypothetical protein